MKIDCHVHSYPVFIPAGRKFWTLIPQYAGINFDELEKSLKKREDSEGIMHGVFYGGNDMGVLPKKPKKNYLKKRVLPMIENHLIQLIGVSSWDNLKPLHLLTNSRTQLEGIEKIIESNGIAIIDQPRALYKKSKQTNRVFLSHKGEASLEELARLSGDLKKRTFLCYNGMLLFWNRLNALKTSELTGIELFGGSDTLLRESSLFSTYNIAYINDVREILENPNKLGELYKGASSLFNKEKIQRISSAIAEEIMGVEEREKRHEILIKEYLKIGSL
jgi:hypothetical protein